MVVPTATVEIPRLRLKFRIADDTLADPLISFHGNVRSLARRSCIQGPTFALTLCTSRCGRLHNAQGRIGANRRSQEGQSRKPNL